MLAVLWLGYQFWRLIWQPAELAGRPVSPGAFDVLERYESVRLWFSGQDVRRLVYPPASYLILWPLLGWLPEQWTVKLWAIASLAAMCWLVALAVRESGAEDRWTRIFVAMLPLSMYATGATVGNGQLTLLVLPMLVAGVLALRRGPPSWPLDIGASLLVLASLVKPTVSAPFFWIVAFAIGRLRPAVLITGGYVLLALAASPFNPGGPIIQHLDWLSYGTSSAQFSSQGFVDIPEEEGRRWPTQLSNNALQYLLTLAGVPRWTFVASLLFLAALGAWVYRHRRDDVWLLLGVSAIVARLWAYHRWYDDILILLPLIALIAIIRTEGQRGPTPTVWLFAAAVVFSLAPGGLFLLPPPWEGVYVIVQLGVWLVMLGRLLSCGRGPA